MTQKQIIDSNKLIGKFIGHQSSTGSTYYVFGRYHKDIDLKYHKLWDWLMPVIDKINRLEKGAYKININPNILTTYEFVITFIRWYNNEKKIK
jgi:hypothetical protein